MSSARGWVGTWQALDISSIPLKPHSVSEQHWGQGCAGRWLFSLQSSLAPWSKYVVSTGGKHSQDPLLALWLQCSVLLQLA